MPMASLQSTRTVHDETMGIVSHCSAECTDAAECTDTCVLHMTAAGYGMMQCAPGTLLNGCFQRCTTCLVPGVPKHCYLHGVVHIA